MSGTTPTVISLKQGATLALDLFFTDDNGAAIDLTQASAVTLSVYDPYGNPVATPTIVPGAEPGWATTTAATGAWPVGMLACEVAVTAAGVTQISDTFTISIQRSASA